MEKYGNSEPPALPGLAQYNSEQMFFITYAAIWCKAMSLEALVKRLYNPHPPSHARVIGVLQNTPEFAKAFKCKPGSKMVGKKVCKIW